MPKTAFFRLLFVSTLVAVFACTASAQTSGTWTSLTTKNFSLAGNASPADLLRTAERLEQFRWAFSRTYPDLRSDNGRPTQIVVFRDADSYLNFLPRRADGNADIGVAGYFQAGEDRNYITFAISSAQADPFSTAVHEYVHALINANFGGLPIPPWLNEGLAEYFENARVGEGKGIVFGEPQNEHLRLLRRSTLIPLVELISMSSDDLKTISSERRRLFYAEAWALVNTLRLTGRLSLSDVRTAIAAISKDQDVLVSLEQEMNRNINGPSLPAELVSSGAIPPPIESAPSTIPAAHVDAILGDLLQHTGENERAFVLLKSALAAKKDDLLANESLGIMLAREEKWADATPYLKRAIELGTADHLAIFLYAFAQVNYLKKDGSLAEIPDNVAEEIRKLLTRSIAIAPNFVDSYRLLATIDFIRDERLDEAVELLQKGLAIRNDDAELQLLLARILLRQEHVTKAKELAEKVRAETTNSDRMAEAAEIIKRSAEYTRAVAAAEPTRLNITLGDRRMLVVLKRSWLTVEDVAQIDRERANNNYNLIILRPAPGELQAVGRIETISCIGPAIFYRVKTLDGPLDLSSADFSSVRMAVAKEGDNTFQIGCGANLNTQLAVINYRPTLAPGKGENSRGTLTGISFVEDDFRLKSFAELSSARAVAVDDDTLKRSGPPAVVTAESAQRSIVQSLRRPQKDEQRIVGTIRAIECSQDSIFFTVDSDGKIYRLKQAAPGTVDVRWFTVSSTQLSATCGSGPIASNTLVTYVPSGPGAVDGELRSIEFIPDGLKP